MRRVLVVLAVVLGLTHLLRAEGEAGPEKVLPEIEEFLRDLKTADWLVRYDRVAWVSSDRIREAPPEKLSRLGPEWFCYEGKDDWHAVYGRLAEDGKSYDAVLHYRVDADDGVTEVEAVAITPDQLALARAMRTAHAEVFRPTYEKYGVRLNPYARREGENVEVWFVPTWQPDGEIAFGQTHRLRFSADGSKLDAHDRWDYGLRRIRPDREKPLVIGDAKFTHPSVGDIFFALYYGGQFESVTIESKTFRSRLVAMAGMTSWAHVVKPEAGDEGEAGPEEKPPVDDPGK